MNNRLALVALLAFTGCGMQIAETPINAPVQPMVAKPSAAAVQVFTSGDPARPHVDITLISESWRAAFGNSYTWDEQLAALREHAAELGCDGVVIKRQMFEGTCIMWTAPEIPGEVSGVAAVPAPSVAGVDPACKAQRSSVLLQANSLPNADARAKLIATAPTCEP